MGRAMAIAQQGLLWLAGNLRVSYGEGGVLALARLLLRAHARYRLRVGGVELPELDAEAGLGLAWPPWEAAGSEERARDAGTLKTLGEAGLLSRESAVRMVVVAARTDARPHEKGQKLCLPRRPKKPYQLAHDAGSA